jgi:hypothetical protein
VTRVAFAIEDAGGARAVVPLIARMSDAGVALGPAAAEVARAHGLSLEARDVDEILAGARLLVTSSTSWGLRLEARAVQAARAMGIPTLTVMDFWSNYRSRLSYPSETDWGALPDCIAVIDETMRADLSRLGVTCRVEITGSPAFDDLLGRARALPPAAGKTVTFLSQPIAALYGTELGYTEHTILRALAAACARLDLDLHVRAHPREDSEALGAFARSIGAMTSDATMPLRTCVEQSIAVTGMTTMALVEAALLGRPSLSLQLGRLGEDALPTNASGLTIGVRDEDDLIDKLSRAARRDESLDTRKRLAALGWRPGATERVLALMSELQLS